MRRWALILVAVLICAAGLGYGSYRIARHFKATDARLAHLETQVADALQLAHQEHASAVAASDRAVQAAQQAQLAAGARNSAEHQRDQAQAAENQAELEAQISRNQADQAAQQAQQAKTELDALRQKRQQELDQMQQALNKVVETRRTPNGLVMVLPDSMFKFGFDSSDLNAHNRELLSRIAGILLASKGYGLSIYGYTDDIGTKEYNQKLSERRADAVRDYLVKAGIEPNIVTAKGFGKSNPLINSGTQQARASNRRVEIAVTDSEIQYQGQAE